MGVSGRLRRHCACALLHYLAAAGVHLVNGSLHSGVGGLDELHLGAHVALHVRAHQEVVLPPFLGGEPSFGLDDGVDPSDCVKKETGLCDSN